jgi:hypothetical protein
VAEPLVLGLCLAPGWAALGVALTFLAGFLLHHPAKLVLADLRRRTLYPRTRQALRVGAAYAVVAAAGFVLAVLNADGPTFLWPLLLAAPVAALQLAYDARNRSREAVPELAGAAALAAVAPAELLSSGWPVGLAAAVWCVAAGRGITSVLYVRTRLRRDRGKPGPVGSAVAAHVVLLGASLALVAQGSLPVAGVLAAALLLLRSLWGFSPWHRVVRPQAVGYQEVGVGLLTTLLLIVGYRLG